jgi:hypothetical protein
MHGGGMAGRSRLVVVLAVAWSLAGCGGDPSSTATPPERTGIIVEAIGFGSLDANSVRAGSGATVTIDAARYDVTPGTRVDACSPTPSDDPTILGCLALVDLDADARTVARITVPVRQPDGSLVVLVDVREVVDGAIHTEDGRAFVAAPSLDVASLQVAIDRAEEGCDEGADAAQMALSFTATGLVDRHAGWGAWTGDPLLQGPCSFVM